MVHDAVYVDFSGDYSKSKTFHVTHHTEVNEDADLHFYTNLYYK